MSYQAGLETLYYCQVRQSQVTLPNPATTLYCQPLLVVQLLSLLEMRFQ